MLEAGAGSTKGGQPQDKGLGKTQAFRNLGESLLSGHTLHGHSVHFQLPVRWENWV